MGTETHVVKASGEREEFDVEKVRKTCLRAGASHKLANRIAEEVRKKARDGMTTGEIRKLTLKLLEEEPEAATRYGLKAAIMSLGPTGFPFERFVAELLRDYGYRTEVGKIVQGKCVDQEVDVVAERSGKCYMIECKYHNSPGTYTDLKVVMYTYARFLDLNESFDRVWLFCNTKLTSEARKYAECVGLRVTSWRYPPGEGLERMVEEKKLYPTTILRSVGDETRSRLFGAGIILTRDLLELGPRGLARATGLSMETVEKIVEEATRI
ncbi:MAG: restriction endonuclease [Hadesarchaea archaeon]|nr:restriction endonuclease [Hadesarchaea archaeon]